MSLFNKIQVPLCVLILAIVVVTIGKAVTLVLPGDDYCIELITATTFFMLFGSKR